MVGFSEACAKETGGKETEQELDCKETVYRVTERENRLKHPTYLIPHCLSMITAYALLHTLLSAVQKSTEITHYAHRYSSHDK